MEQIKTDNSYYAQKVALRLDHLPGARPLRVLDCYAGDGLVWSGVKHLSGEEIEVLPIDIKRGSDFHLPGDNMAYLQSLSLDRFDVIDLDAYGVPYNQLKILFERNYRGVVFATYIQSVFGGLPFDMLSDIGYPEEMIKKCPSMFYENGFIKLLDWLALHGITSVAHRSFSRKHYLYFEMPQ